MTSVESGTPGAFWRCGSAVIDRRRPVVMGIVNVTPDSFSGDGVGTSVQEALRLARRQRDEGALIVDVGGESTRPGADTVSIEDELQRTVEAVRAIAAEGICVSIDTRHAAVARACVAAGASIINDVSGFSDPDMVQVALDCDAGIVVMHMRGEPATMQDDTDYDDVVVEVRDYLARRCAELERAGIAHDRIAIDPGPGFAKTAHQTIEIMRNLQEFVHLGYPVVCAVSRKRFLVEAYGLDGDAAPATRDEASAAEAVLAVEQGAAIVRAHNVAATVAALSGVRPYALLGLGCNVALVAEPGEEREALVAQLNKAIGDLCTLPDTQVVDVSPFYESEPAYFEDQDPFVNAVVLLRTGLPPRELLKYCHIVENSLGRVREVENGPRTCDIDIIDYYGYVSADDELVLPHPRAAERDFVVRPLLDILPGHVLANDVAITPETVRVGSAVRISG